MRRVELLICGVLLTDASPAFAQDESRGEVSAGWRYHHAVISSVVNPIQLPQPNDYPTGWYADVSLNVSPKFAIVGDVAGTYFKDDVSTATGVVSVQESLDVRFHTFMGGVRVRAPQNAAFVPFGQVLFGGERDESTGERSITVFQSTSTSRQETASSNPALALDAGATAAVGPIGVRTSVGYVRFFGEADSDAFRFSLGGVFRF
jgi:hypothetical protein